VFVQDDDDILIFTYLGDFVNTRVTGRGFLSWCDMQIYSKSWNFVRTLSFFDRGGAYVKKLNRLAELSGVK
jgi:hypothetical protein